MSEKASHLDEYVNRLKKVLDAIRGTQNVKSRLEVMTDPPELEMMSVLSQNEARFISITNFITQNNNWGEMFEPMSAYATCMLKPNVSIDGRGRNDTIALAAAIMESQKAKSEGAKKEEG